ncbi:hypothetical protein [Ilumatobacter nonamiensis]|nr:hypothetical protein [Ilumatobacter nonamiensis]
MGLFNDDDDQNARLDEVELQDETQQALHRLRDHLDGAVQTSRDAEH